MNDLLRKAKYLVSETEPQRLAVSVAEVAFIGRSNVGKSSILNAVCNIDGLARVSKTPGRTRMINVFALDATRWLVDLPGYGFAAGPTSEREGWPRMIEGYLKDRQPLKAIYLLIDGKVGPTKLDHQMREWLNANQRPTVIVVNKIDQIKPSQRLHQQKAIAEALRVDFADVQWISAKEGIGLPRLRQDILNRLGDGRRPE